MATGAWIWNLVLIRHFRRDEGEGVASDVDIRDRLLDFRHVARYAIIAWTAGAMMSVFFDARGVRPVRRRRPVTCQAELICRLDQVGVVFGAVHVVATEAGYASAIHQALNKIITLHPVLMAGSICKMRKARLTELVFFQLPEIFQV